MPPIVLVRIGVVADPSNHKTGKVVYQARRFYLKADIILAEISNNPIANSGVFDKCVAGYDSPVVDIGVGSVSRIALNLVSRVAAPIVRAGNVVAGSVEEAVVIEALVSIARILLRSPSYLRVLL